MHESTTKSRFQEVLDVVESLPPADQAMLIDVVNKRLSQMRRAELIEQVREARESFAAGNITWGSAADFMAALDE